MENGERSTEHPAPTAARAVAVASTAAMPPPAVIGYALLLGLVVFTVAVGTAVAAALFNDAKAQDSLGTAAARRGSVPAPTRPALQPGGVAVGCRRGCSQHL